MSYVDHAKIETTSQRTDPCEFFRGDAITIGKGSPDWNDQPFIDRLLQ